MLNPIIEWFQAPTFPEDEDKTRRVLLLNVVLNTILFAMPVLFVGVVLGGRIPRFERTLVIIACVWLTTLGTRFLMLSGRVAAAGVVAVIIIFIAATLTVYNVGTIRAPVTSFYILATVTAGLTISRRAIIWTASISSIAVIILLFGEMNGFLPPPAVRVVVTQGITYTVLFAHVAILLYLAVKSIDEALARVRQELTERVRAKEQEKRRRKMMEKVIQLGKTVTEQTSDLRTALIRIWDCVHNGLDFDRTAIFIYNPDENIMQGSYGTNRAGNMSEEWHLKFGIDEGNSFFKIVLSQPDGYYFTQDYAGERNLHLRPGHPMEGVKYYAAVAVWAGDKPAGIICVDQLTSGRIITNEQVEALRFFAGYAGLAIENARLSEHEQNRQRVMEKVIRIGKEVTKRTTDLRNTLLKIRDSVHDGLGFDRIAIFLYDPKDHSMQGSYGTDRLGNLSEEWDMRFDSFQVGYFQTVLSRPDGFYFTQDYEGELNIASDPTNTMRGVKHYAAVACWGGDKPVAVICVDQLISGRPITEEQLEALRLFAGYAGLAIENTRLNTELKSRMQERENFIAELGNRNAELERFTYTVSHDLRSPIVTIKGFLGMLNKDILEGKKDRIVGDMQRISNATDKMEALLSDLLELSRIGRIINPPEEIDLVKLAYETLETVDGRIQAGNIVTRVSPDLPTIYGDRARIGEVLENLIDNAAKYMGNQPNPLIEIVARKDGDENIICVRDNGIGIDPRYHQKVFGLFEKLNPITEGTGIGLALIKRIVEVHGGRIWVESDGLGKGSTFCFTTPDGGTGK